MCAEGTEYRDCFFYHGNVARLEYGPQDTENARSVKGEIARTFFNEGLQNLKSDLDVSKKQSVPTGESVFLR